MNLHEVMQQTDWAAFNEQKAELIAVCGDNPALEGLLCWIDAVQDAIVEEGIVDADVVFSETIG